MKLAVAVRATLASTLFACANLAVAAEPETMVVSGAAANRIVGLWSTEAEVKPCGTDVPPSPVRNTLLFQAGGTIVENPLFPSGGVEGAAGVPGVYQRSQALGTWTYNPTTGRYWIHLQFDNFIDAAFVGVGVVDRQAWMTNKGMKIQGPVSATRYAADGSVLVQLCGRAVSTRL